MPHYDVVILLTFHEAKDCLVDTVMNFKRYMPNSCIVINNGLVNFGETLAELDNVQDVFVSAKSIEKRGWGMIPVHVEMIDYIKEQNITSHYILPLASNQLFIKDGFYDYMKQYCAGIYERHLPIEVLDTTIKNAKEKNSYELEKYVEMLGREHFKYHSNHDSMFFLYEDFMEMITFFEDFRGKYNRQAWSEYYDFEEEFLYAAFLLKKRGESNVTYFKDYSYWNYYTSYRTLDELDYCLENNFYIMKKVQRIYDDPVRQKIRELGNYK